MSIFQRIFEFFHTAEEYVVIQSTWTGQHAVVTGFADRTEAQEWASKNGGKVAPASLANEDSEDEDEDDDR